MTSRRIRTLTVALVAIAVVVSVALAFANDVVWPKSAWHHDRYRAVGQYIRAHSQADDRIFVWGNSPEIYVYARRRMSSRYLSANYQTGRVWGTPANELGGRSDAARVPPQSWAYLMADLANHSPAYIVDAAAGRLNKMDDEGIG